MGRDAIVGVMLSVAKLTPGQEGYYERSVADGLDDYYAGRGESPGVGRHVSCSSGLGTGRKKSPGPASSPTPAGRADSAAPGETVMARSAPSGCGRLTTRQPPTVATSTCAAPPARTCRPTG